MDATNLPEGSIPVDQFVPDQAAQSPEVPAGAIPIEQFQADTPEQQANINQAKESILQSKYGTGSQQAIAGLEAAGRSTTFGLSSKLEKSLGVNPEDIRGREEANPITSTVGTIGGLFTPGGEGAILGKAGEAIAGKVVPRAVEATVKEGILQGVSRSAVKLAAENALFQAGDENSKMILNDPGQSVGSAITNIGLAGVLGAGFGGALGAASPLWKATVGDKTSRLVSDFKARYKEHLEIPDKPAALTEELSNYYNGIKSAADEVYGPVGLKAQEISKLMPEMSPKIETALNEINTRAESTLTDMAKKGVSNNYLNKFKGELDQLQSKITDKGASSEDAFNALQDFKTTMQGYSKGNWGPFAVPSYHEAYDFLQSTKALSHDLRTMLENPNVWGKAAERQQAVNSAFKDYLPTLKDFEKKFTVEVNGERLIDPGKVNTYLNQLGKPSAEIKQNMLRNFIDSSNNYRDVIAGTHANLGIENPLPAMSTHHMEASLGELTPGAKLADMVIKKQSGVIGKSAAGLFGGLLGHMVGIPGGEAIGSLVGAHALGPFLESVLPAVIKPLLEKAPNGEAFKAATEYGANITRGSKVTDRVIKNVFEGGIKALPEQKIPDAHTRDKIKAAMNDYMKDPEKFISQDSSIGHYMPDHAVAVGATINRIMTTLKQLSPNETPQSPLDSKPKINAAQQSKYNRALDIAEQPLVTLTSIKEGTLTSFDVMLMQQMYPELYSGLKAKLYSQMVDTVAKGDSIPYKTRIGLSLFMTEPVDSSMKPMSVAAAQPTPQQAPEDPNSGLHNKISQGAASTMTKTNKMAQTPLQASESMHSTGKA